MKVRFYVKSSIMMTAISAGIIPPILDAGRHYQPDVAREWLIGQGWKKAPDERSFGQLYTDLWKQETQDCADSEVWAVEIEVVDAIAQYLLLRGYSIGTAISRVRVDGSQCYTMIREVKPPGKGARWMSLRAGLNRAQRPVKAHA